MKAPCRFCHDRKLLCHARCERYQAWKKEMDERAAERNREYAGTPELCRTVQRQIFRSMKRGR